MRHLWHNAKKSKAWSFTAQVYQRFHDSHLTLLAAALAYYAAFSLGPLLILLAGSFGFFLRNRPELATQYRDALATFVAQLLPLQDNSAELTRRSFDALLTLLQEGALLRSVISLLVLIWASSNFFTSLQLALELIFASPQPRAYWRKRLIALILVLSVGLIIGFEIVGNALITYLEQVFLTLQQLIRQLSSQELPWLLSLDLNIGFLNETLRMLIAFIAFILCFRYLPRRSSSWLGALAGALFSVSTILLTRLLLAEFFNIERFNLVYGIITSLLAILLWLYFSLLLFLLGALIAAEISSRQRASQMPKPTKLDGADTVN